MNKNTSVETTSKGQATKVPTGKVKTIKSKEEIRKLREKAFEDFRINALKRRAKRMGMSEEQTNECIEKLKKQLKEPKQYFIHVLFVKGMEKLAIQAIKNANIQCKFLTQAWACIEGDEKILAKVREILPTSAKIHPYAKKAESVLPKAEPIKTKKPSNNNKDVAHAAKMARKAKKIERFANRKKGKGKAAAKMAKREKLLKLKKFRKANIVHLKKTKRSTGSKKASTGLKQAA